MEEKFARLHAAVEQAQKACALDPEDEDFKQEFELAKSSTQTGTERSPRRWYYVLFTRLFLLFTVLSFSSDVCPAASGLGKETGMAASPPMLFIEEAARNKNFSQQLARFNKHFEETFACGASSVETKKIHRLQKALFKCAPRGRPGCGTNCPHF